MTNAICDTQKESCTKGKKQGIKKGHCCLADETGIQAVFYQRSIY